MNSKTTDLASFSVHIGRMGKHQRSRAIYIIPLVLFGGLMLAFGWGLTNDPQNIPSPLVGKFVPLFQLPPVKGRTLGLANIDLKGSVSLVNVFASWCTACELEHPFLMDLAATGAVPVHGLNYKDRPDDASAWLDNRGDPYTRTGADVSGRVGIDWGVYGIPETFVIGPGGHIAYKHVGPLTPETIQNTILPLAQRLSAK